MRVNVMNTADKIIHEIPKAIIKWINVSGASVLYIGDDSAVLDYFNEYSLKCTSTNYRKINNEVITDKYDIVYVDSSNEKSTQYDKIIQYAKASLSSNGTLYIAANNRLGIRYFCGDRDPYTMRNFDGIENYRRAYSKKEDNFSGRMYSKNELKIMLEKAGFEKFKFYSVFSDLNNPHIIIADEYYPNEDLANRIFPTYNYPDTVFLEEETLYQGLIDNNLFHQMANGYLIECTVNSQLSDVLYVTSSIDRGEKVATITIIHNNNMVEKKAAYPEGDQRLKDLYVNLCDLKKHGINVVNADLVDNVLSMPFINAETGQLHLKKLISQSPEKFLQEMDYFRSLILKSSDIVQEDVNDGSGVILAKGYIDFVPLNSFYINNDFVLYDQEAYIENLPANAIIYRMITSFYAGNPLCEQIISQDTLFKRYGLFPKMKEWQRIEHEFLVTLRKEKELSIYHEKCRRNYETVASNRLKINFSETEHKRLFEDVFSDVDNKKIILFGSGKYAERFISMYGKDYKVFAIIDNNKSKQGHTLDGIPIYAPSFISDMSAENIKIIICIKDFMSVLMQVKEMGIMHYSVFDPGRTYPRKFISELEALPDNVNTPKKYHIGYVAGVFDMYHIGHLNLFRRAKDECDYLIVGVVPDKGVYENKHKYPIIPCDERVEIVKSCRYVDYAVELPLNCRSIQDAYKMFSFDCMFTGTDYVNDSYWLTAKEYLKKRGSDLVFLPYTEKTSSTKIRERLLTEK